MILDRPEMRGAWLSLAILMIVGGCSQAPPSTHAPETTEVSASKTEEVGVRLSASTPDGPTVYAEPLSWDDRVVLFGELESSVTQGWFEVITFVNGKPKTAQAVQVDDAGEADFTIEVGLDNGGLRDLRVLVVDSSAVGVSANSVMVRAYVSREEGNRFETCPPPDREAADGHPEGLEVLRDGLVTWGGYPYGEPRMTRILVIDAGDALNVIQCLDLGPNETASFALSSSSRGDESRIVVIPFKDAIPGDEVFPLGGIGTGRVGGEASGAEARQPG